VSDAEKPFAPTPQRLARARREGNVARSSELAANAAFAAAVLTTIAVLPALGASARRALVLAAGGRIPPLPASLEIVAFALLPIASAAIAGTLAALVQGGGLHAVAPSFKPERCNPFEGLKRLLSRETPARAARATFAFALACAAMLPAIVAGALPAIEGARWPIASGAVWSGCQRVAFVAAAVGALFAVAEFAAARRTWLRTLRMSFDERRREAKEQEGDPQARGRRRALHRALSRGAVARVKEASFVLANPTHVAVALEYRPPEIPVPRVLLRAAGELALRVRETAERYGVPVVENPPLARELYRRSRNGEAIAAAHYVAVAEVVAALLRAGKLS